MEDEEHAPNFLFDFSPGLPFTIFVTPMSAPQRLLFLLRFAFISALFYTGSSASLPTCPRSDLAGVLGAIDSPKCPIWIERSFPEAVDGTALDKVLADAHDGTFYSIFFYSSKCSFSKNFRTIFDTISFMFPTITHLAVEESSAMPSVFSRYGVHSFPTLLLSNKTTWLRYHGSKNLDSLVYFYKEHTGEDPVAHFSLRQAKEDTNVLHPWRGTPKEFMKIEPYLSFSILFIISRAFAHLFPKFMRRLKASWAWFARFHVDLGIFSGLNQLLGRVLLVIYGLASKTRNFWKGAKSARVWATSLTSVSLGESSSSRPTLLDS